MLCDKCKKKEATIHIKEVHNGKCTSTNLCADCAREKELQEGLGAFGFNLAEVIFNVGKISGALKAKAAENQAGPVEKTEAAEEEGPVCPVCHWNMEKMKSTGGKLGCPECYKVFSPMIQKALPQVQRGLVHVGKRPGTHARSEAGINFEIEKLRAELDSHVAAEEYEQAAVCRDRIGTLKGELEKLSAQGESK